MSYADTLTAHWGGHPPPWVVALAAAADAHGLKAVGGQLGYSKTALSLALRNRYRGGTDAIAAKVTAALTAAPAAPARDCPVLGAVTPARCAEGRRVSTTHSLLAGLLRLHCPTCRYSEEEAAP